MLECGRITEHGMQVTLLDL